MSNKIMDHVFRLDLPSSEKFLAIALGNHANNDGFCRLSLPRLAAETSQTKRAVINQINSLEKRGIISIKRSRGRTATNVYQFNIAALKVHPVHLLFQNKGESDDLNSELHSPLGANHVHLLESEKVNLTTRKGESDDTKKVNHVHQSKENPHINPQEPPLAALPCASDGKTDFQKILEAGAALFPTLMTANHASIHQWIAAGCDPVLDVIPALQAAHSQGVAARSWGYFTGRIADSHRTRTAPMPEGKSHQTQGNSHANTSQRPAYSPQPNKSERARAAILRSADKLGYAAE